MDGCGNSKKHESEMLELPLTKVAEALRFEGAA
jgi:hypothetical protein